MLNKLTAIAMGAVLVVACGEDASIPTDDTAAAVVGSTDQSFPRHGELLERLRNEGDAETQALLQQAQEARTEAGEAFRAGDREAGRAHAREARGYLHQAIERNFPDLAERMAQRKMERANRGAHGGWHQRGADGESGRTELMNRLRAEADEESLALLDQAAEARAAARAAHIAGDDEEAKSRMLEARQAMHQAIARIDPDLAARMESTRRHDSAPGKGRPQ